MHLAEFEPAVPESEPPPTHALDRAPTGSAIAVIAGSNFAEGVDVRLLCLLCVV